jgi:hypothetical protein
LWSEKMSAAKSANSIFLTLHIVEFQLSNASYCRILSF